MAQQQLDTGPQADSKHAPDGSWRSIVGNQRLAALAAVLEAHQQRGKQFGMQQLRELGFGELDVRALMCWVSRQA
jgi:hypothetical protein